MPTATARRCWSILAAVALVAAIGGFTTQVAAQSTADTAGSALPLCQLTGSGSGICVVDEPEGTNPATHGTATYTRVGDTLTFLIRLDPVAPISEMQICMETAEAGETNPYVPTSANTCAGDHGQHVPFTVAGTAYTVDLTDVPGYQSGGDVWFSLHIVSQGRTLYVVGGGPEPDARITIRPDGINEVGDAHRFTAHVDVKDTTTFAPAPAGTRIDFSIVSGPGAFVGGASSCTTVAATGECAVQLVSGTAGTTVVAATSTVTARGLAMTRSTNGNAGPGGSGNATKHWVDAYVRVTPDGVNEVRDDHVFTVELGVIASGGTVSDVEIDYVIAPDPASETTTCANPTPVGGDVYTCTVTISSPTTGVFLADATARATVTKAGVPGSVTLVRSTDPVVAGHGPGGNDGATKTYVDARISVGPDGLNAVGDPHTVTAKVETKVGNGGWTAAPAGTVVDLVATGAGGFVGGTDSCTTDGNGSCSTAIVSDDAGVTVVSATATLDVAGVTVTRSTNPTIARNGPGGSDDLTKRWVDASVRIEATAVNEVGDDHEFTVTATAHRPGTDAVDFVSITPSVRPAPAAQSTTCDRPTISADGTTATCTFTINSDDPGIFDVDATAVVRVSDGTHSAEVTRSTNPAVAPAGPSGSAGATKTYVDARIAVGPDGVNAVGDAHTVTGTATYNDGTGWAPAAGRTISFAITQGIGDFVGGTDSCVTGPAGTCSVAINSATPGLTWVSASTSYAVGGVTLNRTTAVSGPTDPDNLRKEWVATKIVITPDATNEVGDPHTFTIVATTTTSGAAVSGTAITTNVSPAPTSQSSTCDNPTLSANGTVATCTLTINSDHGAVYTATATVTANAGGVALTATTNGTGDSSGPATKTYVDARISVGPDGVNAVGDPHPVNAHLEVDDGTGWRDAGAGVAIDLTQLSGPGTLDAGSCTTDATGRCGTTLRSSTVGTTVVAATASVDVGGLTLTRSTNGTAGPGGSDNLVKQWADASISITPDGINEVDDAHTFTVTVTAGHNGVPVTFDSISTAVSPAPASQSDTCATPVVNGDTATCTLTINHTTPAVFTAHATAHLTVGGVGIVRSTNSAVAPAGPGGSGPAEKTYVGGFIRVTPDGVNAVGDPHTFTVELGVLAAGGTVTSVAITPTVSPAPATQSTTCSAPVAAGADRYTCTVTVSSPTTGVFDVDATGTATVAKAGVPGTVVLVRSTDPAVARSGPGGNAGATKTYVDARISIGPDGLNAVNDDHTVTATVETKTGNGGWTAAPVGTTVTFAESGAGGFTAGGNSCTTGADGKCSRAIVSANAGVTVVSATATVDVGGVTLTRSTDSSIAPNGPGGSGNLTKRWVDASITIEDTAVNEVHDDHVFTITATAHRPGTDLVDFVSITPSVTPNPATQSTTCTNPSVSADGTVATCTFTINSPDAGIFDVDATAVVRVSDGTHSAQVTRSTDPAVAPAGPSGSAGARKTYVDALLSVGADGVNEVGDPHPVVATAERNDGTGWRPAVGERITFQITQGPGGFVNGQDSCIAASDGTCAVAIVSDTPGVTWVSASTSYAVGGVTLNRTTAVSGPTDGDNLRKEWVRTAIVITPDATNRVGDPHTFSVTARTETSGAAVTGTAITTTVTPAPTSQSSTCATPTVSADGKTATCTLTINSDHPAIYTATASTTSNAGGATVSATTDGTAPNSGPARKTYVDASIRVTPDGVNEVGDPHTVTGHVSVDDGTGTADAPDGTVITFAVIEGPGSLSASSCTTGSGTGACSVTLTSTTTGVTKVRASSGVVLAGLPVAVSTDAGRSNGGPLTKRWVDASIRIGDSAVNPLNQPHTFTIRVTGVPSGAGPVQFTSVTTSVTPQPGSRSDTCAAPVVSGDTATCTLTINSPVVGQFTAHATAVLQIGGVTLTRSTDTTVAPSGPDGSGGATKRYEEPAVLPAAEVLGVQLARTGWAMLLTAFAGGLLLVVAGWLVVTLRRRQQI